MTLCWDQGGTGIHALPSDLVTFSKRKGWTVCDHSSFYYWVASEVDGTQIPNHKKPTSLSN